MAISMIALLCASLYCWLVGISTVLKRLFGTTDTSQASVGPALELAAARRRLAELRAGGHVSPEVLSEIEAVLGLPTHRSQTEAAPLGKAPLKSLTEEFKPAARPIAAAAPRREVPVTRRASDIKTLLISGAALFILSAYIFVRSYWDFIPDAVKFAALALMTGAIYGLGRYLLKKTATPKTAETLIDLGVCLIPFNVVAANLLLFHRLLSPYSAWALGFVGMLAATVAAAFELPTFSMGALIGAAFHGTVYSAARSLELGGQARDLALATASLVFLAAACLLGLPKGVRKGAVGTINAAAVLTAVSMSASGFYLSRPEHLWAAVTLALLGAIYAVQARLFEYRLAYAAGLYLLGALALLLHHLHVPLFKFGLFFVPASLASAWRAWTFERAGRKDLAGPYFHLAQLAVAGSIAALLPSSSFYLDAAFPTLMLVLALAAVAYGAMGAMYGLPAFTFASGTMLLLAVAAVVRHEDLTFAASAMLFAAASCAFLFIAMTAGSRREEQLGRPLSVMGLGTLSLSLAALAGRWLEPILSGKALSSGLPPDQLQAGIRVGLLCTAAYAFFAFIKKRSDYLYPSLASATLVCLFGLERLGLPVNPSNVSLVVAATMVGFYLVRGAGWEKAARCFAIWGQLLSAMIAVWCLSSAPESALPAAAICFLSLAPSVWLGQDDLTTSAILAAYLLHRIWFQTAFHSGASDYALQLVFVNCAVVAFRTALSLAKPTVSIQPFRILAAVFAGLSMLLVVPDAALAWQIFAAYGVLAITVSLIHYEGRHLWVGTTLLVAAYEFYISSIHVELKEAYTVPPGVYALACGYLLPKNDERQETLYTVGQLLIYAPSFYLAMSETWQLHGIFVGVASLCLMVWGMSQRNRCLTTISLAVMIFNGCVQSRQVFESIPRWAYLALGGVTLVGLGGLYEFQSKALGRLKDGLNKTLSGGDRP